MTIQEAQTLELLNGLATMNKVQALEYHRLLSMADEEAKVVPKVVVEEPVKKEHKKKVVK